MWKLLTQLLGLLTPKQRIRFYRLQILVVLMAFAEIIGIASIGPFMALVANENILFQNNKLGALYKFSNLSTTHDFIFIVGICVLVILALSAAISMITTWRLSLFSTKVGSQIGDRLYQYYMYQPWLYHASGNSAQLTKKIATESNRITGQIINPLMQMNAKVVLASFLLIALFVFNPLVAMAALLIFICTYAILYKLVRERLLRNGRKISEISTLRYKLMSEGFGGIKDVLLLGRQQDMIAKFQQSGRVLSQSQGTNQALAQTPRYLIELVAYSLVIFLILYLIKSYKGNLGLILPVLAVYALAGFKILPAFQQIYMSIASIKGGMAAFESVREDLINSESLPAHQATTHRLELKKSIELKDVTFTYPNKSKSVLNNLNMIIPVNKTVGIVGSTGSGKSTAIDIMLGLIQPASGALLVDGQPINRRNVRAWQNDLGYVAQSIFLADASFSENIAYGLPESQIDAIRVKEVIKLAHLEDLVNELPDGIDTRVGERGVQLSGGQRQRIGIARALYNDASVLIFDEATSALDGITEKLIMDAINNFYGKKTIIMIAHRLNTIKACDVVYLLSGGRVLDSGTFEELATKNSLFKSMTEHA